ncbi:MAG TPA: hypothetical protein VGQ36_05695 [Thermoanaerobaculia bacterium]|jgi:hypothetical protein|nr:hypothetical protein [Thermoanaerobaculia bacterium]
MHDPMALVSDSTLGILALIFAFRLWSEHRMWALAFVFTAAAGFVGGIYHGYGDRMPELWKVTVISVGIASFFLLAGTHRRLAVIAAVKLVVFLTWMTTHDDFLYVVVDYGITLILIGIFHPAKKWVLGSIAVSILGAVLQQSRVTVHPYWFDYNDIYHVIQMVALWMLYRASCELRVASSEGRLQS